VGHPHAAEAWERQGEDIKSISKRLGVSVKSIRNLKATVAQNERKRKDRATGPHLVFHATPFVLQRFCNKKKKRNQPMSPTILATWLHDLLSAMLHFHSHDVILRNF
jgi:transposase